MPAWWEKKSNPSSKREEHQSFSEDWKRIEKPNSSRHWNLAKNRGTETGFGSGSDSNGVLEKRGHPLPRPTHHGTVSSSVSSICSSGSSNGQPDYGFIGPCRYSDPMTLTRGSINSGSPRQQQGENRHPFMSDLLPDMSASPRSEYGQPRGEATPPTIKAFCSPRASPEVKFNPRSRSPMPAAISKGQTNQTSPFISRACGYSPESSKEQQDDRKNLGHPLPLPPSPPSSPPSHILRNNAANKSVQSLHSRWKKGKLLGRGTFGHVYLGFNSKNGRMCAIKEVRVISDDKNSSECLRQLNKEIFFLSQLTHRNIVQYYGSELNDSTLSVYLEYVPGGSIHKLLQEYGPFKEPVIQSYTRQILSGLFYLHARNTAHRDIKGANILVGPNGEIKLADFGMAKHITPASSSVLSLKGSPYWMAPEVIMNCDRYHLAVDIWSLGCTILEMATSKPPWSQYEGVAAIFTIGNSKEIPQIPDHLSDDGKDFLKLCLQRDPSARPTAAQLLQHPFIHDEATLRNAKININRDIMQPNSDISYMPEQNKPVVHSNQKITTKCEEYGIRHMGGLPMDSKNSRYSKDIFSNMGFGIDDYSSITVISRAGEGVHASRQVGYGRPLNGLCVEG